MKWISFNSKTRLYVVSAGIIFIFALIILRILYIQIFQYDYITEKAKENWDREIPFVAERGLIVDRSDQVIVSNELAPTVYFMPAQNKNVEDVAKKLAPLLEMEESKLLEKLQQKAYLVKLAPEGKNVSIEVGQQIAELNLNGVYVAVDYRRQYPHGQLLARLLGFTGFDYTGLSGLEYAYDDVLTSSAHAIRMYTDAKGSALSHLQAEWLEGKEGANVQLTIDLNLQKIVERELSQAMLKHDADQAWAIAMNPNNGEILALASLPSYDPLKFQQVKPEIFNRNLPVFMSYEPGSTFKIITLAAALEEKVVNLEGDHFHDHGYTMIEGARLRCWKREGHGDQTFLQVVENSCNPGFIELGRRVGPEKLQKYIRDFGFGESTNSTIAGEARGILFSEESYGPVEHATTSFGQGVSVTPIQQVQAISAAVNGGYLYQPTIVKSIYNTTSDNPIFKQEAVMKRRVISDATSAEIRKALESVVANGSGRNAYRDGLRIGGKTGTAQKVENGRYLEGNYIVSFVGVAPANKPEIVVYVAIDNPKSNLLFGGVIAAPVVGNIIEDYAKANNTIKDLAQMEREYKWGDPITMRLPDFTNQKVDDILKQHYHFKIEWHGEGTKIIDQLPKPNELINDTETLHLYLSD